jgi:hypothetical protein
MIKLARLTFERFVRAIAVAKNLSRRASLVRSGVASHRDVHQRCPWLSRGGIHFPDFSHAGSLQFEAHP